MGDEAEARMNRKNYVMLKSWNIMIEMLPKVCYLKHSVQEMVMIFTWKTMFPCTTEVEKMGVVP